MKLDAARSRLKIYTFAEGFLSALAHDLELVAGDLEGHAEASSAEVRAKVAALRVSGVMKRGRLDGEALSESDRAAIERQIREGVLPGEAVVARGVLDGSRATIDVTAPRGTARVTAGVSVERGANEARAKGSLEIPISALGAPPVKGPMGAFRVRDHVRVEFDLVFRAADEPRPA
jgi:hypothetical protein